jgi:hypothetical protein
VLGRLAQLSAAAAVGFCVGWVVALVSQPLLGSQIGSVVAEFVPLPHHVPPVKGGAALRFAMVHDVLHERYPRHSQAYHAERVRVSRAKLATLPPDDPAAFALADDLAVALDRLGRGAEAVPVLDEKLRRQVARNSPERERYTTYANLGTILSRSFPARWAEGQALVRKSVEVNPNAHFGRERWQSLIDGRRATGGGDRPATDVLGNPLDLTVEMALNREMNWIGTGFGRPTTPSFSQGREFDTVPAFFEPGTDPADAARWEELRPVRDHITRVGPLDANGERGTVPFDEPTVAIVGIWRQVRGPDAHLALALGETMLRVGHRHLAWSAFERAQRLAEKQPAFPRDHCRARQKDLEESMTHTAGWTHYPPWQRANPPVPAEDVAALRPRFEAELAHGEAYQRAYQEHEERQIAAGVALDDPHFYDAFHAGREPIASPVGPEEWFAWVSPTKLAEYQAERRRAWGLVGAGLAALAVAALLRRRVRR